MLEALARLSISRDLVLCDGYGYARPRRFGLACHLSVPSEIPTISVAKSHFVGRCDEVALQDAEEQKTERRQAIPRAMIQSARVPLVNGERCGRVLELCAQLRGCSNPNAASDLECAGHLARAGVSGCVANVLINVPSIKDEVTSAELVARAHALQESGAESNGHNGTSRDSELRCN